MNLTNLRTTIGIGTLALTLLGGASALVPPAAEAAGPTCQGKEATIVIKASDFIVEGTSGNDVVVGLAAHHIFKRNQVVALGCFGDGDNQYPPGQRDGGAFDGHARVYGASGADVLRSGQGDDQLFGGRGSDQFDGGDGQDLCSGGKGTDHFVGTPNCEEVVSIP